MSSHYKVFKYFHQVFVTTLLMKSWSQTTVKCWRHNIIQLLA